MRSLISILDENDVVDSKHPRPEDEHLSWEKLWAIGLRSIRELTDQLQGIGKPGGRSADTESHSNLRTLIDSLSDTFVLIEGILNEESPPCILREGLIFDASSYPDVYAHTFHLLVQSLTDYVFQPYCIFIQLHFELQLLKGVEKAIDNSVQESTPADFRDKTFPILSLDHSSFLKMRQHLADWHQTLLTMKVIIKEYRYLGDVQNPLLASIQAILSIGGIPSHRPSPSNIQDIDVNPSHRLIEALFIWKELLHQTFLQSIVPSFIQDYILSSDLKIPLRSDLTNMWPTGSGWCSPHLIKMIGETLQMRKCFDKSIEWDPSIEQNIDSIKTWDGVECYLEEIQSFLENEFNDLIESIRRGTILPLPNNLDLSSLRRYHETLHTYALSAIEDHPSLMETVVNRFIRSSDDMKSSHLTKHTPSVCSSIQKCLSRASKDVLHENRLHPVAYPYHGLSWRRVQVEDDISPNSEVTFEKVENGISSSFTSYPFTSFDSSSTPIIQSPIDLPLGPLGGWRLSLQWTNTYNQINATKRQMQMNLHLQDSYPSDDLTLTITLISMKEPEVDFGLSIILSSKRMRLQESRGYSRLPAVISTSDHETLYEWNVHIEVDAYHGLSIEILHPETILDFTQDDLRIHPRRADLRRIRFPSSTDTSHPLHSVSIENGELKFKSLSLLHSQEMTCHLASMRYLPSYFHSSVWDYPPTSPPSALITYLYASEDKILSSIESHSDELDHQTWINECVSRNISMVRREIIGGGDVTSKGWRASFSGVPWHDPVLKTMRRQIAKKRKQSIFTLHRVIWTLTGLFASLTSTILSLHRGLRQRSIILGIGLIHPGGSSLFEGPPSTLKEIRLGALGLACATSHQALLFLRHWLQPVERMLIHSISIRASIENKNKLMPIEEQLNEELDHFMAWYRPFIIDECRGTYLRALHLCNELDEEIQTMISLLPSRTRRKRFNPGENQDIRPETVSSLASYDYWNDARLSMIQRQQMLREIELDLLR